MLLLLVPGVGMGASGALVVAPTPIFTWIVDNREKVWDVLNRPRKWLVENNG